MSNPVITDAESIEWAKRKSQELAEGPYYLEAVKLAHLADYAERLRRELKAHGWIELPDGSLLSPSGT